MTPAEEILKLKAELATANSAKDQVKENLEKATGIIEGLQKELQAVNKLTEKKVETVKVGGKTLKVVPASFLYKKEVILREDVLKDKGLAAELFEAGLGIFEIVEQ
jgi:capsule polysaccharide export protein KpsE/RkpR